MDSGSAGATKDIFSLGNGLEMLRVDAAPDPAKMINLIPVGDRSHVELIGHAMDISTLRYGVADRGQGSLPKPTPGTGDDDVAFKLRSVHM